MYASLPHSFKRALTTIIKYFKLYRHSYFKENLVSDLRTDLGECGLRQNGSFINQEFHSIIYPLPQ